jgi:hypothetical protein
LPPFLLSLPPYIAALQAIDAFLRDISREIVEDAREYVAEPVVGRKLWERVCELRKALMPAFKAARRRALPSGPEAQLLEVQRLGCDDDDDLFNAVRNDPVVGPHLIHDDCCCQVFYMERHPREQYSGKVTPIDQLEMVPLAPPNSDVVRASARFLALCFFMLFFGRTISRTLFFYALFWATPRSGRATADGGPERLGRRP